MDNKMPQVKPNASDSLFKPVLTNFTLIPYNYQPTYLPTYLLPGDLACFIQSLGKGYVG